MNAKCSWHCFEYIQNKYIELEVYSEQQALYIIDVNCEKILLLSHRLTRMLEYSRN